MQRIVSCVVIVVLRLDFALLEEENEFVVLIFFNGLLHVVEVVGDAAKKFTDFSAFSCYLLSHMLDEKRRRR